MLCRALVRKSTLNWLACYVCKCHSIVVPCENCHSNLFLFHSVLLLAFFVVVVVVASNNTKQMLKSSNYNVSNSHCIFCFYCILFVFVFYLVKWKKRAKIFTETVSNSAGKKELKSYMFDVSMDDSKIASNRAFCTYVWFYHVRHMAFEKLQVVYSSSFFFSCYFALFNFLFRHVTHNIIAWHMYIHNHTISIGNISLTHHYYHMYARF